jgi:hypothetical protein
LQRNTRHPARCTPARAQPRELAVAAPARLAPSAPPAGPPPAPAACTRPAPDPLAFGVGGTRRPQMGGRHAAASFSA